MSCRWSTSRNGGATRPGREDPGGDLVEQRLEEVVVGAVDERDVDVGPTQELCGEEPAEAPTDDEHPWPGSRWGLGGRAHEPTSTSTGSGLAVTRARNTQYVQPW